MKKISIVLMMLLILSGVYIYAVADTTPPSVTISGITSGLVIKEGESLTFKVYFDDETELASSSLSASNITTNGFTATKTVTGGAVKTVTLSNIKGSGTGKSITIAAGVARDFAGNTSKAITSRTFSIEASDVTSPTVAISKPSPSSIYEGDSVKYTVYFDDETGIKSVNFNSSYVVLNGFTASISISGSGNSQRTVTLTNIQGVSGSNNYITVKAGAVTDTSGNTSKAITSSKFTIKEAEIKDTTLPTVTISKPDQTNIYAGDTVRYTVYFDDETGIKTVNFNSSYVMLNGFTANIGISGSGSVRVVTLTNIQGVAGSNNYIAVKAGAVTDTSGNVSKTVTSSKFTTNIKDITIPTVAISKPNPSSIYEKETVKYTVYFDDETGIKSVNFNSSYVALNGFTANISISGSGNSQRTVTLTNIQGVAGSNNYIAVKAGAVTDTSGNTSKAITSSKFTIKEEEVKDNTSPTVTISKPNPSSIYEKETVKYTVYFDDEIGIKSVNFNSSYVALNGFTANISVSGSGNSQRTVTLTNIQGTSGNNNYITVKAGAVTDTSGNTSKAVSSSKFEIKIKDNNPPKIEISKPNPSSIYEGDTVEYTAYFSDDIGIKNINLNSNYIVLNGFNASVSVNGTGNVRIITLSNIKGNIGNDKYIAIKEGAATDTSNNKTIYIKSDSFEIKKKQEIAKGEKDTILPVVKIGTPIPKTVNYGETVKYIVNFSDNVGVVRVNLTKEKIKLIGFSADVIVKVNGIKSAEITLKNIKGNAGVNKYIKIDSGVAIDKVGNRSLQTISQKFILNEKKKSALTVTKYKTNCIDDLRLLGDINKEIDYFASWLRAEKYTASYVQENNYVAEDELMTYMVEYYNGSTTVAKDVLFNLTIPYKVDIDEINGNGKITKMEDDQTIITWNIGDVPSYVASNNSGYCRLYVRVKFLENKTLELSDNISEVFYTELSTKSNNNISYSYMRQLFIDKTEGKTGTYKSYLTTFDTTNEVRPDDEITRAEFVKLIADSGLVEVKIGSNKYKEFKDYESIPSYSRDAVSALYNYGIVEKFSDDTFKPNNPIITDDALEIIAKLSRYVSNEKLITYKPVFLYKNALIGTDKKISDKKDYIMELMRENVIVKYKSDPNKYLLRKKAVEIINSLSFRGPYVELLPENTLKFIDIRDDSTFFYNIVGASNSYKYTYDYRLWQQIIEIE